MPYKMSQSNLLHSCKKFIKNNTARHVIRLLLAVFIAVGVRYYFLPKEETLWLIIATVFVMLTSTANAFYHGLWRFFLLFSIMTVSSFFLLNPTEWHDRMNTILLGALIGISTNSFILPDLVPMGFCCTMVDLLKSYKKYFSEIIIFFFDHTSKGVLQERKNIEQQYRTIPSWIYQTRWDISMKKGYDYFFTEIIHISEMLFALHYVARFPVNESLLQTIRPSFLILVNHIDSFMSSLIALLELKPLQENNLDFNLEIQELEKTLQQTAPVLFGWLDKEKEHIYTLEFLYHLKILCSSLTDLAKTMHIETT